MNLFAPTPGTDWQRRALAVLRIVVGLAFMMHGTMKLFGFPATPGGGMPTPPMFSQFWFAGVLETFGGAAIVLGLLTRPVAFLLCGEMAVAYFQAHFPKSFWPTVNQGEAALLFCFVFLYLAVAGPGAWSLDDALFGRTAAGHRARDGHV